MRLDDAIGLLFAPLHSAAIRPEETHLLEWAAAQTGRCERRPQTPTH